MTFLVLLRKSKDKKQCHYNVSEKFRILIQTALDFKLNLDIIARRDAFSKILCCVTKDP